MTVQQQRLLGELKRKLRVNAGLLVDPSYFDVDREDGSTTRQRIPGLIAQLDAAIALGREQRRMLRSKRGSPIVISVQAFDIMASINRVTRQWDKNHEVQVRIGNKVSGLCMRPVDGISDIRYVLRYLESWVRLIRDLFEPPKLLHLVAACPQCRETTVTLYHMDDVESVQAPALQIMRTSDGLVCECFACGTRWPQTHFLLLAQTLGCEAVV